MCGLCSTTETAVSDGHLHLTGASPPTSPPKMTAATPASAATPPTSWTSGLGRSQAFTLRGGNGNCVIAEDVISEEMETLRDGDALIAPRKTGICGSDVHFYKNGSMGGFVVDQPMVLGHESSGVVLAVGSRVKNLVPGDLVSLEPGETCGTCALCLDGKYELCPEMKFAATPPTHGTLQTVYKLPAHLAYKLPKGISLEEGAMIEPLAVGVHAVYRVAQMRPNQNVVIFGAGPVGLLAMAACKALGARRIIGVDVQQERLDFAMGYAATDVYFPTKRAEGETMAQYCRRNAATMKETLEIAEMGFEGIDVVIECTGAEPCIQTALNVVKPGGSVVQVGFGAESPSIPAAILTTREIKYMGSWRYGAGVYQTAIDLVSQKKVNLKPLITHRYSFEDSHKAFLAMVEQKGYDGKPPVKVIIDGPVWEGENSALINNLS